MGDRTNSAGSDRTSQERGTFSGLGPSQRIARLDPAECMRLITPGGVGRVGYTGAQGPEIVPVNFAVINEAVVFRTLSGGVLERLAGDRVAFEVDRIDEATRSGWNVLVQASCPGSPTARSSRGPGTRHEPGQVATATPACASPPTG